MADEEVLREGVVEESPAGAHDGLAFAAHVPGKAHAWREIIQVALVQLIKSAAADLHQPALQIKITKQIVLLADDAEVVIAQSEVQRQPLAPAEGVLQVSGVRVLKRLAPRIAFRRATAAQGAGKKIFERSEVQPPAIARVKERVNERAAELVAHLQIMPSELPRQVIDEMPVRIDAGARHRERRAQ